MLTSKILAKSTLIARFDNDPDAPQVQTQNTGDFNLPEVDASPDKLKDALVFVFGIIITVAIIYIIIGGIQLIASQGDPQKIAKARQTILYAVIGLVISISAEFIVLFVLGRI